MLDKPVIQYVVEESLEPEGVDGVVIVNSHEKPQIEQYFSVDETFESMLAERGKSAEAARVHEASTLPVSFVYQDEARGLGHAVLQARRQDRRRAVLRPSRRLLRAGVRKMCVRMAEVSREHGGASVIAVAPVPADQVSRYGIVAVAKGRLALPGTDATGEQEGAVWRVTGLVEKPRPGGRPLAPLHRRPLPALPAHHGAPRDAGPRRRRRDSAHCTPCSGCSTRRRCTRSSVDRPAEARDTGTPAAWAATNARMALDGSPAQRTAFLEALGERGAAALG